MGRYVLPLLFLLGFFGCVGVFPKETMRECDVDVSLPQLVLHPERYKGKTSGERKMAFPLLEVK